MAVDNIFLNLWSDNKIQKSFDLLYVNKIKKTTLNLA